MDQPFHILIQRSLHSQWMRGLCATVIIVLAAGCMPEIFKDDHIEVGTVIGKTVSGFQDGDSVRLLYADVDDMEWLRDHVEEFTQVSEDNVTVPEEAAIALSQAYADLQYRVKVRLCIRRTTEEYMVNREFFNALRLGVIAKFRLNDEETAIDSLIAY